MYRYVKLIILSLLICLAAGMPVYAAGGELTKDSISLFIKANEAYNKAEYKKAAGLYENIIKTVQNGYLFFNLGNCYLKSGQLGKAVLNYKKAQKLIPEFEDLNSNLDYARGQTKDKIENKDYFQMLGGLFFWHYFFNLQKSLIIFLALNFLLFLILGILLFYPKGVFKWFLIIISVLYLCIGSSALVKIYGNYYVKEGVVTAPEIEIRSGDAINNVVLFKLHEGTEVLVQQARGNWLKVKIADGKKGWTQISGVDTI